MPFLISSSFGPYRSMEHASNEQQTAWRAFRQDFTNDVLEGKYYDVPHASSGFRFPVPDFTIAIDCDYKADELKSIMQAIPGMLFTQAVIDIIEDIEPGVHQYFPVELVLRSGEPQPEPYYLLNICTRPQTLDYDRSDLTLTHMPKERHHILPYQLISVHEQERAFTHTDVPGNIARPPKIFCHADKIKDRAVWFEYGYNPLYSDEFVERVNALVGRDKFHGIADSPSLMLKLFIGVSE